MKASIEYKKQIIETSSERLEQKTSHLSHKKSELDAIMAETSKEEEFLNQKSAEYEALIEPRLLAAYKRIRSSVRNGLAVVSIERGASAGSFFTIPPQTQVEIAARKKIITDEHSGRILVDSVLAEEEKEKWKACFQASKYLKPRNSRLFYMKKIKYVLLTKSVGFGLNLTSYIQPKKATLIAYRMFSEPRIGKLNEENLPTILQNVPSQNFEADGHFLKLMFGKGIQLLYCSFTVGKVILRVGKNYYPICKKQEVRL